MKHQDTEQKLNQKNTRPTSMRILVYDFLAAQSEAMSLADIESHLEKTDRITLYRTLKTFEEKGIVHSVQENATTKYTLCADDCDEDTHRDWHLHLYCKMCKKTTCREDFVLPDMPATPYRIDEVRFFAKGICEDCLNEGLQ